MWGCLSIKTEYGDGGVWRDAYFFDALARSQSAARDFEDFRADVCARVSRWEVYTEEKGLATFDAFGDFVRYISIWKIAYLFVYDAVRVFSFIDWSIHDDSARGWVRSYKDDQKDDAGRYKKVTGNAFTELSGELGQRYSYTLWSTQKRTRAEGGDRHERTHGTDFYGFKNIFNRGIEKTAAAFGVRLEDYGTEAEALHEVVKRFSSVCETLTGAPYCGDKKPLSMTAGGLAKRELLRHLCGSDNHGANVKKFKSTHPLTRGQDDYLRARKLMRGGICYANPAFLGDVLGVGDNGEKLKKYDVSSEYSAAAYSMPDFVGALECCDAGELFAPVAGYTYIAVLEKLEMIAKKGMPAIFQNPFTGKNPRHVSIYNEIAFFWDEIQALRGFYTMGDCVVRYALRVKNGVNFGYKKFIDKYYGIKEAAREQGNYGFADFAKLMLNGAWGKLSQRADFPVMRHEFDPVSGLFRLLKFDPLMNEAPDPNEKAGGLSVVQGAYVTMRGRVLIMDYIRKTCGDKNARETLVYTDTDSILTYATAPDDIVAPHSLGKLKLEGEYIESKFLAKKVYYNVESVAPLRAGLHCRGIPLESITGELLENYGVDSFADLPAGALADAFTAGLRYPVPILANVRGGRAVLYLQKAITEKTNTEKGGARHVGDENGRLVEI